MRTPLLFLILLLLATSCSNRCDEMADIWREQAHTKVDALQAVVDELRSHPELYTTTEEARFIMTHNGDYTALEERCQCELPALRYWKQKEYGYWVTVHENAAAAYYSSCDTEEDKYKAVLYLDEGGLPPPEDVDTEYEISYDTLRLENSWFMVIASCKGCNIDKRKPGQI